MMLGYTIAQVAINKRADGKRLGVKLGRLCMAKDIPVKEVAEYFSVSRITVYKWFSGRSEPSSTRKGAISILIAKLSG